MPPARTAARRFACHEQAWSLHRLGQRVGGRAHVFLGADGDAQAVCKSVGGHAAQQDALAPRRGQSRLGLRSEEHTSELQSLMRISYAVFCLKKKKTSTRNTKTVCITVS